MEGDSSERLEAVYINTTESNVILHSGFAVELRNLYILPRVVFKREITDKNNQGTQLAKNYFSGINTLANRPLYYSDLCNVKRFVGAPICES